MFLGFNAEFETTKNCIQIENTEDLNMANMELKLHLII